MTPLSHPFLHHPQARYRPRRWRGAPMARLLGWVVVVMLLWLGVMLPGCANTSNPCAPPLNGHSGCTVFM